MQNSVFNNNTNSTDLEVNPKTQQVTVYESSPTISVIWDKAVQDAVINTSSPVGPTVASRAYAMMHTAMYNAWSAYDPQAISTQLGDIYQRPDREITEANKSEAMSYAANRVLNKLFPDQTEIFDDLMNELGFDPNNNTANPTTNAGIGNLMASELLEFREQDGSNQLGDSRFGESGIPYSDTTGYESKNTADNIVDIERWTPELVINSQKIQNYLTPQWGNVTPFA